MGARSLSIAALIAAGFAGGAGAQYAIPPTRLFGGGDAIGALAFRQALDCYGKKRPLLGRGSGAATAPDFSFSGAAAPASFDCAARIVQPGVTGWYSSAGPAGIAAFAGNDPAALAPYPAGVIDPDVPFPDIHYGLSSSAVAALPGYDPGRWGRPIQLPLYAVPIAIAYDPVYAKRRTPAGVVEFTFNLKPGFGRADGSGGLRLDQAAYCAIFNPAAASPIINWNDARISALNGGQSLQDPDEAALGIAFDVPVRLVGRAEAAPATMLWTRHLAAVCGSPNAYADAGATLPAASLGGAQFVAGASPTIVGDEQPQRYLTAQGAAGVAQAIDHNPAPLAVGARSLNGKIGYLEPDLVLPTVRRSGLNAYYLATASLKQNGGFLAPSPQNATRSLGETLPPQSDAGGNYNPASAAPGDRADFTAWIQPDDRHAPLAAPASGYPIVGTTNALLYACYADPQARAAIAQFFAGFVDRMGRDSLGATVPAGLFTDPSFGLLAGAGLGALPAPWKTAIAETFFKQSSQPGAQVQPLKVVATGSKMAINAPVMTGGNRMFRQRTPHLIVGDLAEIRIGLMNWFHNGRQETPLGNDVTYRAAWLERASSGEIVPVTFGGRRTITLAAGDSASHVPSDPIPATRWATPPRAGELFWVHLVGSVPDLPGQHILDGMHASYAGASHKRYPLAADAGLGIDYGGPVPTIPGYNGSYDFGVPILFLGRLAHCCSRAVAAVGDSITKGDGDTDRATLIAGIGYGGRASVNAAGANPLAVLVLARTGESAADFLASNARRIDLLRYADIAHVAYGTNDIGIGPGAGAGVIAARLQSIRALIRAGAPTILAVTENNLLPRTGSTDAFASVAGQTPVSSDWQAGGARDRLNQLLEADRARAIGDPLRIDALFDMLAAVRAPGDGSRWNANGKPRGWAFDGVHPASLGYERMAAVARAGWLALDAGAGQGKAPDTLGARNLWIQDKPSATRPAIGNPLCSNLAGAGEAAR